MTRSLVGATRTVRQLRLPYQLFTRRMASKFVSGGRVPNARRTTPGATRINNARARRRHARPLPRVKERAGLPTDSTRARHPPRFTRARTPTSSVQPVVVPADRRPPFGPRRATASGAAARRGAHAEFVLLCWPGPGQTFSARRALAALPRRVVELRVGANPAAAAALLYTQLFPARDRSS